MQKCTKAEEQLLVEGGARNTGREIGVRVPCLLGDLLRFVVSSFIGGSSYSTKYLGSVTTLQGVVQCYSMFNRSSSPTPCTARGPQDNANAVK